jgi:hypothetical protein
LNRTGCTARRGWGVNEWVMPRNKLPEFHGDAMSTCGLMIRTWEHIENKGPEEAFFQKRTWEHIERKGSYQKL